MNVTIREIYDRKIEYARSDNKDELVEIIGSNTFISTSRLEDQENMIYLESENPEITEIKDCISESITKWYNNTLGFDPVLLYNILQLTTNSCMIKI